LNSSDVRFARWADKNVWHTIFAVLRVDADFEEIFIDSTAVRIHQHAAGAAKIGESRLWDVLAAGWPPRFMRVLKRLASSHDLL
jgi:transposase